MENLILQLLSVLYLNILLIHVFSKGADIDLIIVNL